MADAVHALKLEATAVKEREERKGRGRGKGREEEEEEEEEEVEVEKGGNADIEQLVLDTDDAVLRLVKLAGL